MTAKVYKRTDSSRDIPYQDALLSRIVPGWPDDVPIYYGADRDILIRPTRRAIKYEIYCASLALFADEENDLVSFLKAIKARGHKIICAEESLTWSGGKPIGIVVAQWRDARKAGAAMRGAIKSAATRKAATAEKLESVKHELESTSTPTKEILARVGVRSVNSIKNHFGYCREEMQRKYEISQKRKARKLEGKK